MKTRFFSFFFYLLLPIFGTQITLATEASETTSIYSSTEENQENGWEVLGRIYNYVIQPSAKMSAHMCHKKVELMRRRMIINRYDGVYYNDEYRIRILEENNTYSYETIAFGSYIASNGHKYNAKSNTYYLDIDL